MKTIQMMRILQNAYDNRPNPAYEHYPDDDSDPEADDYSPEVQELDFND